MTTAQRFLVTTAAVCALAAPALAAFADLPAGWLKAGGHRRIEGEGERP